MMSTINNSTSNNKRIAKNTLLLYARMLFLMLVSLYTSRVILNALGVEDYGIYQVVGGLVTMFSVLSSSLSGAISRFITFELGRGNTDKLKKVFSSSVTIQIGIALFFIVLAETVGLWFINYKMHVPEGRLIATNWCFQFSVLTFAVNLISVPYHAAIIAHEKMSSYAYISIFEGIGKLCIAWLIAVNPIDRLIFFALMMAMLAILIRYVYAAYCKRHFKECTYHFFYDYDLLKRMFAFAGWSFFGAGSWHLMKQGVDLLSNLFFGVTVNAARGIASQVDGAIMQFVNNFTTAINPQITKSYASNQKDYMYSLMFRGAKFSYFLVLLFAIPIICETPTLLQLWLKVVPEHTVNFVRLAVIISLISVLSNTMVTAMLATGNIKKYQIIIGGIGMLVLPLSWLFFALGWPPEMAYISIIAVFLIQWSCRLFLIREMTGMSIKQYFSQVMFRVIVVTVISFPIPLMIFTALPQSYTRFFLVFGMGLLVTAFSVYQIGLTRSEKTFIRSQINSYITRLR